MKWLLVFCVVLSSCALPPGEATYMVPSKECCVDLDARGLCLRELVPGCASNASPLFKETFLRPDECCERWGRNGICYKEVVAGCSKRNR